MTERENYLLTMAGKQPEWVPNFEDACDMIIPALLGAHLMTEEKRDFFSVPWTINDAGPMVDNHQPPVMEDVTEWKKYVHFPDLDQFDWENTSSPAWRPGAPEELVRGEVRKCIDQFAVGGGMMFWTGGQVGTSENQIQLSRWADDEVRKYGREFYWKEQ